MIKNILFLDKIFAHVERTCCEDYRTFDDELKVRVDAEHVQSNEDDTENKYTDYDTADITCASDE